MSGCARGDWLGELDAYGFAVLEEIVSADDLRDVSAEIERMPVEAGVRRRAGSTFAVRNAVGVLRSAARLARHERLCSLAAQALGGDARVTRSILFDKNAGANWSVPWHQDTTIAVRERRDVPGFGPWSVKAGVPHVQPPREVLEGMLTLRLHVDDCDSSNGALRVLPGSHAEGVLECSGVESWKARVSPMTCEVKAGGVLAMRPLLLHASSPADSPRHRRVLHLEFAARPLPGRLAWCDVT